MRTITATEASRHFSDLLDAIERGEAVVITRGGDPVARIGPVPGHTWADLTAALDGIAPPDDDVERAITDTLALLEPWTGD